MARHECASNEHSVVCEERTISQPVVPRRVIASNSTDFVLFRIGMRFNGPRGFVPALKTFLRMPKMLVEQQSNPAIGMLWSSTALSWSVISITQFWQSFEDLEWYAHPLYGLAAVAGSEAIAPSTARARARIEREPAA